MTMHKDLDMEYLLDKPDSSTRVGSAIKNRLLSFMNNRALLRKLDGLQADYAIAMDQCQLMKQHIQELESKIANMNAKVELRPEAKDLETPYSVAIMLAKKGCSRSEIIGDCGLTESEADLILALHNRKPSKSRSNIAAS